MEIKDADACATASGVSHAGIRKKPIGNFAETDAYHSVEERGAAFLNKEEKCCTVTLTTRGSDGQFKI